jgi:pimeloyl-ACP methyl ester carboxylesterase
MRSRFTPHDGPKTPGPDAEGSTQPAGVTRGELLHRGLAAGVTLGAAGLLTDPAWASTLPRKAPHLPPGFDRTFTSQFVKTGNLRQHAVIGGDGPPLLLVHGWPENWYAWRHLMPTLARDYRVVAVDQRGMGLSDKPREGYDPATIANDLAALMDALGHQRFAVVGCDTGMVISYALAADHPDRVERLVVGESVIPGVTPSPPLFVPGTVVPHVWHLLFNRLGPFSEHLVKGKEDTFFGFIYAAEAGTPLPDYAVRYYVTGFASSRDALRGSFEFYRAWDVATEQNQQRATRQLTLPVLALGGALGLGAGPAEAMKLVEADVQSLVIPNCGHWLAEEAPNRMLAALAGFLAPYRNGS